ncbi:MAG TPA: rRNA maturation RNase YbeY, partial [Bacteroidales bacterium]|nr:rRNA maturation RNase YbeY [Bacteroidales bacterium]
MPITFDSDNIEFPNIKKRETSAWIKKIANSYNKKVGNVGYLFCNDEKILEINRQYLDHDFYTDIISFDYSEGDIISGDIFISLDTVRSNSQKYNTDYKEELHRVIIHGVLHLCGLDDKMEEDANHMREAENSALKQLYNN